MKTLYLITGSIGVGKSTIASLLLSFDRFKAIEFVSADVYKKMFFNDYPDLHLSYQMGSRYMEYKVNNLIASEKSFALEMVPSKKEKINFLKNIKHEHSYNIIAIYIGISNPSINISRISKRVIEGADVVQEAKILSRQTLSLTNITQILELANVTYFIDNTDAEIKLVACKKKKALHVFTLVDWFEEYVLQRINSEKI